MRNYQPTTTSRSVYDGVLTLQVNPQVVGVEDLEFTDRLEVLHVLRSNLGDFKETHGAIVLDEGTTLFK